MGLRMCYIEVTTLMQQQAVYSSVEAPDSAMANGAVKKSFPQQLRNNATIVVRAKQQCEIKHVLPQWHSV